MSGPFTIAARASSALLGRSTARRVAPLRLACVTGVLTSQPARFSSSSRQVKLLERPSIHLDWGEGKKKQSRIFPNLWLRDNCQCKQCINQDTRQRNFNTFEIPEDIQPVAIEETSNHLIVEWSDSHKSQHPWTWLETWQPRALPDGPFGLDGKRTFWNASIADTPPEVSYEEIMSETSEKGIAELTKKIWETGFSFVVNTPPTPEATQALLEKIGPIRTTHYGGFYDFIPDLALADTAYTNLALPAHTDTTYFTEPAGLQAFHLLSHIAPPDASPLKEPLGGKSLLVDGFNAAQVLKQEDPKSFTILTQVDVPWHASGNKGVAIVPDKTYPVIETVGKTCSRVRWNNDDRGVVEPWYASSWYKAAAKWDEILRRKENEYWFQLEPGRVVIFDNWRVLHGRSAFEGVRRICGGYIPRDDFVSRYRTTNFPHEVVIGRNLHMRANRRPDIKKPENDPTSVR